MIQQSIQKYPINIQKQLGWLFFFLAWPVLAIGVNITFYIFLLIIYSISSTGRFDNPIRINDFLDKTIFAFILWALFCSITQPSFERNPGFLADFKYNLQHVYWMALFLFIKNNFKRLDLKLIGKYTFWGSVFLIISYNFFPGKFNFGLGSLTTKMGRNAFVYQIECIVPIVVLFMMNKGVKFNFIVLLTYLLITILTNGRAGTFIVFLYFIGYLVINKTITLSSTLFAGFIFSIFFTFGLLSTTSMLSTIAESIRPLNERVSNLLVSEDDGDLEFDKSWLERQIHIAKGLEIFSKYPIKGVGLNHFMYFDADYSTINLNDYFVDNNVRISENNLEEFNKRSAHNSYMQILAETGFIGISLYLLFLIPITIFFIRHFVNQNLEFYDILLLAIVCVSIHNWVISAYSGAISFAIFGLGYGRMRQLQQFKKIK
jgi:O-antigen ligase